jgi:putative metallohydrolase (TIGR04338 family)
MAPTPPRDSQRSRVYRAETPLGGRRLPELAHCRVFCDEVVGSLWWTARFPTRDLAGVPRLRPGNGARQAFYREDPGHPTITLPRRYRTTGVVLHELVHWVLSDAYDLPNHGRTFTRLLLEATDEFLGASARERLAQSYTEHAVKIGPPPRISPDGRYDYAWDERLRRGRGHRLTIGYAAPQATHTATATATDTDTDRPDASATGVLRSRAHRKVTLVDGELTVTIPERSIWSVSPVASPTERAVAAQG